MTKINWDVEYNRSARKWELTKNEEVIGRFATENLAYAELTRQQIIARNEK